VGDAQIAGAPMVEEPGVTVLLVDSEVDLEVIIKYFVDFQF
jgi:hypothetical protein